MSGGYSLDGMRVLAAGIERREQRRLGGNRDDARARAARKIGLSPGTLYNLARDRLKGLDGDIRRRIAAYAVRDLEGEIATLTAELATARRLGAAEDQEMVRKVSAILAEAQALHAQIAGPPA